MSKVKNDPTKYLKRSDLYPKGEGRMDSKPGEASEKRERDFLTAPIDQAGYIDFRRVDPKRHRRKSG
jgi:hypothetical protein